MKEHSVCDGIEHNRSDKDFTHIHNEIIRDKRIDMATKGVFLTLWSLPDTWEFCISGLIKCFGGSTGMWVRTMKLLTEYGYMRKIPVKHEGSNLQDHFKYIFCDNPSNIDKTVRDFGFRNYDFRNCENQQQLKTNCINKESKSGGGTHAHEERNPISQPTNDAFYAWFDRMSLKYSIQDQAREA